METLLNIYYLIEIYYFEVITSLLVFNIWMYTYSKLLFKGYLRLIKGSS